MYKIYKIIILIILIISTSSANSHVQHYKDLNRVEFDIYRNNKHIGKHIFTFKKLDIQLIVESEIKFRIKKFGLVLYRYHVKGTEVYENGKLVIFNSKTDQNGKKKYVNMQLKDDEFIIDGSRRRRQDREPIYMESSTIYGTRYSFLISEKKIISDKPYAIIVNKYEAIDINDLRDFELAELLIKKSKINKEF